MTTEKKNPNMEDRPQEVERIRDIIFGPQMRTYDTNFQTIQRDLDRLASEINRLNEKLDEQDRIQAQKLQTVERELRKANEALRAELRDTANKLTDEKVDRHTLADLLIDLGSQLKSSSGAIGGVFKEMVEPKGE